MSITRTPDDSMITFTLAQMQARMTERADADKNAGAADVTNLRSGLLYMGNVHDAVPRRLLLDTRLSPLDKTAWMMIRLYAQQNQGAVFPTYDELQQQLATPFNGRASRETVSRVLLMLRLTGWLSLCRRVRDNRGRVRGNIYAQHDEPLLARDAETLDPTWLDTVGAACEHKNRTVSQTAWSVLSDIQNDPMMRHQHSWLSAIAERLGAPQTPQQMAGRLSARERLVGESGNQSPGSVAELSRCKPGSVTELSQKDSKSTLSSFTELLNKSVGYDPSVKPNCNVRNFTHSVNKKTYVPALPVGLKASMTDDDYRQITSQLQALPDESARQVLESLTQTMLRGNLNNPVGWLLTVIKRARNGKLYSAARPPSVTSNELAAQPAPDMAAKADLPARQHMASRDHVRGIVAKLRLELARTKKQSTGDEITQYKK